MPRAVLINNRRPGKILFVIDEIQTLAAGTEGQILQLIRIARDTGLLPHLATLRGSSAVSEESAGCPVSKWNLGSLSSAASIREYFRFLLWLRRLQFDAVQSFFPDANMIVPILARLAGIRNVISSRRNQNYWMTSGYRHIQRFSNLLTSRLVANCEAVKIAVAATEAISPNKIDVVVNGIDTNRFRPCSKIRQSARNRLGIPEDAVLIGIVANLRPVKRIDLFICAAAVVAQNVPQARFVIVGEGPLRSELDRLASQLEICDVVQFAGRQSDPVPYLNAFDIGVLCSDSEGLSNTILEYLACGLPCVVSRVGGNEEAIGECGVVVPASDYEALAATLIELAMSPNLRNQYAESARKRACAEFSLEAARRNFERIYLGLFNLHAPPE